MLTTDLISGIYPKTHKNNNNLGTMEPEVIKWNLLACFSLQKYVIPAALYILPHYRLDLFNESVKIGHVLAYFFQPFNQKPIH